PSCESASADGIFCWHPPRARVANQLHRNAGWVGARAERRRSPLEIGSVDASKLGAAGRGRRVEVSRSMSGAKTGKHGPLSKNARIRKAKLGFVNLWRLAC